METFTVDRTAAMSTARLHRATAMPTGTPHIAVAIVGAGACGLTAALALREAGVECVLLERDATPQGSTGLSSGFIPAAGSAVQLAAGVQDSAQAFAADIQAKARGTAAPLLVQAYTEASAPAMALLARHGLQFELLDGFLYPGHHLRRMHSLPQRTGSALVAALATAAEAAGALTLTEALVTELWCDDSGRVLGLGFERPDGRTEHLACAVTILANNGFGGDAQLVRQWLPQMQHASFVGHRGNDGSAIAWAQQLGLALGDLGGYQGHGSWAVPQGTLITWALMMEGGVQVNALGRRFHDETQGYSEAAVQVLAQPGGVAWNVFDSRLLALGRSFPDFCAAEAAGAVRGPAELHTLAAWIGCDAQTLQQSLMTRASNGLTAPSALHESNAATALTAPYFAIRVTGALFHTQGGIDIDARCQALYPDGRPHPNLLAAGGAARGVSGNAVWGYLSGNGLLSAVAGGFIAGQQAAARVQAGCG